MTGTTSPPPRRGANESAAIPPASASTGRPASSARVSVGAFSGSTPTILMRPWYQDEIPAIKPPPPHGDEQRRKIGRLAFPLQAHRPLTEQGLDLIEGVNRHCPRPGYQRFAR